MLSCRLLSAAFGNPQAGARRNFEPAADALKAGDRGQLGSDFPVAHLLAGSWDAGGELVLGESARGAEEPEREADVVALAHFLTSVSFRNS